MGFVKLFSLCVVMFFSSFIAGSLVEKMPAQLLRYITTIGVGLLIGVAFIVIIPEGVHTYYGVAENPADGHQHNHQHTHQNEKIMDTYDSDLSTHKFHLDSALLFPTSSIEPLLKKSNRLLLLQNNINIPSIEKDAGEPREESHSPDDMLHSHQHNEYEDGDKDVVDSPAHNHDASGSPCLSRDRDSSLVGLSLVLGFVIMLFVDRLSGGHSHAHGMEFDKHSPSSHHHNHNHSNVAVRQNSGNNNIVMGSDRDLQANLSIMNHVNNANNIVTSPSPPASLTSLLASQSQSNPIIPSIIIPNNNLSQDYSSSSSPSRLGLAPSRPYSVSTSNSGVSTPSYLSREIASLPSSSSGSSPIFSSVPAPNHSLSSLPSSHPPRVFNNTALLGILIHSAIDGLAFGAISVNENAALEWVVFLAIILHKSPAALGVSSFLLYQGRSKGEIRYWIMIFSLAAPITSLITYLVFLQSSIIIQMVSDVNAVQALHSGRAAVVTSTSAAVAAGSSTSTSLLGLCLLFSAGTFLFTVAAHILPEISKKEGGQIEWKYILCLVIGILAPLGLGGHHHH